MRKLFISLGRPIYVLLYLLFSKLSRLTLPTPNKIVSRRKKLRRKEVVIYKAKSPYLKNFLKLIYPLSQLRFPVLKIPEVFAKRERKLPHELRWRA